MSHKPHVPPHASSPYPLDAEAAAGQASARHDMADRTTSDPKAGAGGQGVRIAVGAAIGSAAIAAALIHYNRSKPTA